MRFEWNMTRVSIIQFTTWNDDDGKLYKFLWRSGGSVERAQKNITWIRDIPALEKISDTAEPCTLITRVLYT